MSVTDEIDEMIRLRATRVPSINQMRGWKAEIERLRGGLHKIASAYPCSTAKDMARVAGETLGLQQGQDGSK